MESFRNELQLVKNPHSKDKLARKITLLEAAAHVDKIDLRALPRVLGTNLKNIHAAVMKRQSLESTGFSIFRLAERRKRPGLLDAVTDAVASGGVPWQE